MTGSVAPAALARALHERTGADLKAEIHSIVIGMAVDVVRRLAGSQAATVPLHEAKTINLNGLIDEKPPSSLGGHAADDIFGLPTRDRQKPRKHKVEPTLQVSARPVLRRSGPVITPRKKL
jgi:hypothetical protein